ncbi:methylenetetrahydrofolate reductase-like protein [Pseudovirgaria hyperparasitica]|uniref:Methylenetetrahydrofolate reductase-like protein n=1 Tax=Pseudovirgaria hyperparasitica TaxID=470096 RepID=A0A6A6VTH9_9PEZI|nr:methylenetetrahydrofolate reductase-like protein [Pseudovirgaria hyperparasitica]KAF2753882.1 methylenetetrahydrofolate reductase-like protein [Pseudovirgaria hyperparasitica]
MEKITDKLAALPKDGTYFSLEFFPPKTQMGFANLQDRLHRMANALHPLFVNVTWGAGGSTASKSLELAELTQRQLGLTTCLHLTCTNSSRELIDKTLEQAKALGIRNILALRGDPPRSEEYRDDDQKEDDDSNKDFTWAVDLVRYIRKQYGDYFCIGVAGYPEGHSDESHPEHQDPKNDLPYLVEKTKAGADFIMTQLFFDTKAWDDYEDMLRKHESGVFKNIPIIPGLMPVQSYQILRRITKLSHAKIPTDTMARLDAVKGDDEAVKQVGVDIICEIVEHLKTLGGPTPRGFHFYTLNLERSVTQIVERCDLIAEVAEIIKELNGDTGAVVNGDTNGTAPPGVVLTKDRRRLSSTANSTPRNRLVVERPSSSSLASYEALDGEAGVPKDKINTRANALAISEGKDANWDDYPNGRWGDARSPAYGEIDGYGPSLHVTRSQALKYWSHPVTKDDISSLFRDHLSGTLEALPWSEDALSPETATIRNQLLRLNAKGWWTVASQPAVNGLRSTDSIFGWGPRSGFVYQKPFVEFFLPAADWAKLQPRLDDASETITYFAGNRAGGWAATDTGFVTAVTWGAFHSKEIVSPTIIEAESFRAWREEAFQIWDEWQRIYPPRSASSVLLDGVKNDVWLVNVISHAYVEKEALWEFLAQD